MSEQPTTLITIATYNEKGSLEDLVRALLEVAPRAHPLVIDDSSPDGTGQIADRLAEADSRVRVMHRSGKLGLGTAVIAGMQHAMREGYERVLNMDADFSHHPRYVPAVLKGMADHDVMIGSRYIPGGGLVGWGWKRTLMSAAINVYTRLLLRLTVRDCSGAFRCYRTTTLRRVDLSQILSQGYAFMEEILYRCQRVGCRIGETPIVFEDRRVGASKISYREAVQALWVIFRLGMEAICGFRLPAGRKRPCYG